MGWEVIFYLDNMSSSQTNSKFKRRLNKLQERFAIEKHLDKEKKHAIRDIISLSFADMHRLNNETLQFASSLSQGILQKSKSKKSKAPKQTLLDQKMIERSILTVGQNGKEDTKPIKQKKSIIFESTSGEIFDIQDQFKKPAFPVCILTMIDCTLKESSLLYIPLSRDDNVNKLQQMSMYHEDPLVKSEYIFEIYRMSCKQYIDIIGYKMFPSVNMHTFKEPTESKIYCVQDNPSNERMLAKFKTFEKFFFEGMYSMGTQLNLGDIKTNDRMSFINIFDNIQILLTAYEQAMPELRCYIIHTLEIRIEELLVFLSCLNERDIQFGQIYQKVVSMKGVFYQANSLEKLYKRLSEKGHQWFVSLQDYIYSISKKTLMTTLLKSSTLLRSYSQQLTYAEFKHRMRAIIQQ